MMIYNAEQDYVIEVDVRLRVVCGENRSSLFEISMQMLIAQVFLLCGEGDQREARSEQRFKVPSQ